MGVVALINESHNTGLVDEEDAKCRLIARLLHYGVNGRRTKPGCKNYFKEQAMEDTLYWFTMKLLGAGPVNRCLETTYALLDDIKEAKGY